MGVGNGGNGKKLSLKGKNTVPLRAGVWLWLDELGGSQPVSDGADVHLTEK